jgi:hypothetical protein
VVPVWEAVDLDGVPARDQLQVLGHEAPVTRWSSLVQPAAFIPIRT